ncbi:hypothetical protein ABZ464_50935 [Streptomyces sp. NPDC005820]
MGATPGATEIAVPTPPLRRTPLIEVAREVDGAAEKEQERELAGLW